MPRMTTPAAAPKSTFWILFFIVFIDLVGFGIVFPILPEITRTYQLTGFQTGLIIGIYSLMQFLFSPVLGQWSDKIGRRPILVLSMAGTAISFFLMGFAGQLGSFFEISSNFIARISFGSCFTLHGSKCSYLIKPLLLETNV